jgi:hypothetical protein
LQEARNAKVRKKKYAYRRKGGPMEKESEKDTAADSFTGP